MAFYSDQNRQNAVYCINHLCEKLGITPSQFAEGTNIDPGKVSDLMLGLDNFSETDGANLAKAVIELAHGEEANANALRLRMLDPGKILVDIFKPQT
jgi:hypothetical protein